MLQALRSRAAHERVQCRVVIGGIFSVPCLGELISGREAS